MLVALHLPKTAGNSFGSALRSFFGAGLQLDYRDMFSLQTYFSGQPAVFSEPIQGAKCVHGHFLLSKYINVPNVRCVTWVRDPVERLYSHYEFFRRSYNPATSGPLFRRIIEEEWSIERFCFCPEYQNIYTKYLDGIDYRALSFIGVTNRFASDLYEFSRRILDSAPLALPNQRLNANPDGNYTIDIGFRREVEAFHASDVEIYRFAEAGGGTSIRR